MGGMNMCEHGAACSLLEHCRKHKYLAKTGETFVRLVVRLMERLLDYRTIMHDESKENRMSCTVNVLVRDPPPRAPQVPVTSGPGDLWPW